MGLTSMTGYGKGSASGAGVGVEVELSSVNRKQFDARVSLPRALGCLEARAIGAIRREISRGAVSCAVAVNIPESARGKSVRLDLAAAKSHVSALRKAAAGLGLKDDISARTLLVIPDLVRVESAADDPDRVWPVLSKALAAALTSLLRMRHSEGRATERDLRRRLAVLCAMLVRVKGIAPRVADRYRAALLARIEAAGVASAGSAGLKPEDIAREVALFADRSDISEEIARLEHHLSETSKLLASSEPVGRTLDFLCQEMFREINTIGSKANDSDISSLVVKFKSELECVREQVQNVE